MGHFNKLTHSKFLANIAQELKLARDVIQSAHYTTYAPQLVGDKALKKQIYHECMLYYNFYDEIEHSFMEGMDVDNVYCIQCDYVVFAYSLNYSQLKETMKYLYNVNGEFPFCRSRHKLDNRMVHTVLYDTRVSFVPISPN